jgi:alkanesulfonate monooxygenase SsuD/methylene tetrahydromethanopterin reductase-like flavin-dependent oxidoreductase (luciferase family)
MKTWYFNEAAYPYLPDESEYESIRVTLPSRYYDPEVGAGLWDRYIDEWQAADELGLNVMVNEHHATATCMNPAGPVISAVLARVTKSARIVLLGNPIANRPDPVRVAEEMALVDTLSHGRLEVGFVRSVPYEVLPSNASPVGMAERMWEAHDLIKKAWTTADGPFNWEGKYFQHRSVNIWPRPVQQPHPPIWMSSRSVGGASDIAERGYVCATFLGGHKGAKTVFDAYKARRAELGLEEPGLDRFAYAALVYTGRTEEEGRAGAEKLLWYIRANKIPIQFKNPPGYASVGANIAAVRGGMGGLIPAGDDLDSLIERGIVFAGSPDSVYQQIMRFNELSGGIGHLLLMGQSGFLEHDETVLGIETFAREVQPRLTELELAGAGRA